MLKMASSTLRMSPTDAMHQAESLYLQGYLTYPRTESSTYPPNYLFKDILDAIHTPWAEAAVKNINILNLTPRKGVDAGDHPPISPTSKSGDDLSGTSLVFYNMILKHFLAGLLSDAEYVIKTVTLNAGT